MDALAEALILLAFPLFAAALWRLFGRIADGMEITRMQLLALIVFFGWLWN